MQQAQFKVHQTLVCPTCGKDSDCSVDHLLESAKHTGSYPFGPWECRACKMRLKGMIRYANGETSVEVEAAPKDESHLPVMSLLVIPPQKEPIYLLKHDSGYVRPGEDRDGALDRHFYFNSHSCPTNWMNGFETIQIGDDADPHGMIRFVRAMHQEDFDKIEAELLKKHGLSEGSSTDISKQEILETAFPEVAKRFIPTCDDFGQNADDDEFGGLFEQDMREVPEPEAPYWPPTPAYRPSWNFYGTIDYYFARLPQNWS